MHTTTKGLITCTTHTTTTTTFTIDITHVITEDGITTTDATDMNGVTDIHIIDIGNSYGLDG